MLLRNVCDGAVGFVTRQFGHCVTRVQCELTADWRLTAGRRKACLSNAVADNCLRRRPPRALLAVVAEVAGAAGSGHRDGSCDSGDAGFVHPAERRVAQVRTFGSI